MNSQRIFLSSVLMLCSATVARGQVCEGFGSYSVAPMQVFGRASFASGANGFDGAFGLGNKLIFGSIGLGTEHIDALNASTFIVGLSGGLQAALSRTQDIQLCPVVGISFDNGPNNVNGSGIDLSEVDFSTGLAVGGSIKAGDQVNIDPVGALLLAYASAKASDNSGNSVSQSTTYGILSLALGVLINQRVSFRPGVSIPLGLTGGSTSFGLAVAINFGTPH